MFTLNNKSTILLIFILLFFPIESIAFDDICIEGGKVLNMTTAQMKEYYKRYLSGDRIEGRGKVYDVIKQPGFASNETDCIIIVRCDRNKDVLVYVNAGNCFGSTMKIKRGKRISFTGDCYGLTWKYYRDSDVRYIEATIKNANISF